MEVENALPEDTVQAKCYFYHESKLVDVPLVSVDYAVSVVNNIAKITLRQKYANPLSSNIELHFAFPIDTDFCFGRLMAHFEGYITEGVILERQAAKQEYKAQVKEGNTVALAVISSNERSIMNCKLGNLPPGQTVEIEYDISCQLQLDGLTHWQFRLPSHISPRYKRQDTVELLLKLFEQLFSKEGVTERSFFTSFKWNFELNLQSTEDIVEYELIGEPYTSEKLNDRHFKIRFAEPTEPLNDITLRYTHNNFNKPLVTVSSEAAIVSFLPDSNTAAI